MSRSVFNLCLPKSKNTGTRAEITQAIMSSTLKHCLPLLLYPVSRRILFILDTNFTQS